jgi:hypothetical protein
MGFGGFFSNDNKVVRIYFNIPFKNTDDAKNKRMRFLPSEKLWYFEYKIPYSGYETSDFSFIQNDKRLKNLLVDYEIDYYYFSPVVKDDEKKQVKCIVNHLKIENICDQIHYPECECLLDKHNSKCSKCKRVTRTGKIIL